MPDVFRVVAVWGGFAGSPGYSNLYFNAPLVGTFAAQGAVNATRQFFEELKAGIPLGVTIQVDSAVAQIDEATGVQNDEFVVGTPAPVVTAAGAATRAAPVGACVNWRTGTFVNGRRLRGRTFIVPLATSVYEADGTLGAVFLSNARAAAATLAANGPTSTSRLVVWHRPINGAGGVSGTVTSGGMNDRAAVLTSRRA